MAKMPNKTIGERIDAVVIESYPRPHLGASQLGHPCTRSLVYSFHWAFKKQVSGKLHRIFSLGDKCEDLIIEALESIGINHYGGQDRIIDSTGHAGGSVDGKVTNVPGFEPDEELLFEAKSMNHNNFLEVKRQGVQMSKPVYYGQMQMYMGRMELAFGLFVAIDKNTSDLYTEIVPFDADHFIELCHREEAILDAFHIEHFPRISTKSNWFQCKFCDAQDICHNGATVEANCRTCEHHEKLPEGKWQCNFHNKKLTAGDQRAGCDDYQLSGMWI